MKIKAVTLNLFEGGKYFKNIEKFFKEENPDILCLQEAYNSEDKKLSKNFRSIEVLRKILPNYYHDFAPEFLHIKKEGRIDMGNTIFSKFPIIKTAVTFYDSPYGEYRVRTRYDDKYDFSVIPRNLQYAKIKLNGMELNVFNTHGIWGYHGNDTTRRLKMGETIIREIKDKDNIVLAGDFNLFPTTQTVKNIQKYLKNVFDDTLPTTFNMKLKPHPGDYANSTVDMMFTSKNIRILKKYCSKVDVSDHFPLVCVLEIQKLPIAPRGVFADDT